MFLLVEVLYDASHQSCLLVSVPSWDFIWRYTWCSKTILLSSQRPRTLLYTVLSTTLLITARATIGVLAFKYSICYCTSSSSLQSLIEFWLQRWCCLAFRTFSPFVMLFILSSIYGVNWSTSSSGRFVIILLSLISKFMVSVLLDVNCFTSTVANPDAYLSSVVGVLLICNSDEEDWKLLLLSIFLTFFTASGLLD